MIPEMPFLAAPTIDLVVIGVATLPPPAKLPALPVDLTLLTVTSRTVDPNNDGGRWNSTAFVIVPFDPRRIAGEKLAAYDDPRIGMHRRSSFSMALLPSTTTTILDDEDE